MADTGWLDFTSFSDIADVGTVAWLGPSNAATSNDGYANNTFLIGEQSHTLHASGPSGLSIPAGSVISGIEFRVEKKRNAAGSNQVTNHHIYINGTLTGSAEVDFSFPLGADAYVTYGSPGSLWGLSWDSSSFGTSFGFGFSMTNFGANDSLTVDHIQVKVYYNSGMFFVI